MAIAAFAAIGKVAVACAVAWIAWRLLRPRMTSRVAPLPTKPAQQRASFTRTGTAIGVGLALAQIGVFAQVPGGVVDRIAMTLVACVIYGSGGAAVGWIASRIAGYWRGER